MAAHDAPQDPKDFNVEAFLGRFTQPTVKVPLYRRADLLPEIDRLDDLIGKASDEPADQGVADDSAADRATLTLQRNQIVADLESSAEWFEFTPLSDPVRVRAQATAEKAGHIIDLANVTAEQVLVLRSYQMAETCISHPGITGAAFLALQEKMGDATFIYLLRKWLAVQGVGDPDAPFSPPVSPTPTTETP